MNMQALLVRATVFVVLCLGLALAAIQPEPEAATRVVQLPIAPVAVASEPVAQARIVVLPAVQVRPAPRNKMPAARSVAITAIRADSGNSKRVIYAASSPTVPNLRMDMPYFSFGKSLPHASKE